MVNLRVATQNLHWPNNQAQYARDINRSKSHADVIIFQEVYNAFLRRDLGDDWEVYQPTGGAAGHGDNAVAWRKNKVDLVRKDFTLIGVGNGPNFHKQFPMVFAVLEVEDKKILIGSLHMPHGKYIRADAGPGDLYDRCADNLVEFWKRQDVPLVVGGDWNKQLKSDPANLSHRLPARWIGGHTWGIDGFLTHNRVATDNNFEIPGSQLESDHPVVGTVITKINAPSDPEAPPDDTPGSGNDQDGDVQSDNLRLVTANIGSHLSDKAVKADFKEFNEAWNPDLWMVQESAGHIKALKEASGKDYEVVVGPNKTNPASISQYFVVKTKTFRVLGITPTKVGDKFNVTVSLKHRKSGRAFYATTCQLAKQPADQVTKQVKALAIEVETNGKKPGSLSFLGGDFNIDEHQDNKTNYSGYPNAQFTKHDIVSIYDELKTPAKFGTKGPLTVDVIANYKKDAGVKAKQVTAKNSRSDHKYVLGVYDFTFNVRHPTVEPVPEDPGEEPSPLL